MINDPIITLDCDWAPDFVILHVANLLNAKNIKATWFVTNNSPALHELQKNSLFELGIHPNFEKNSTQGKDLDSIIQNLKKIIPEAKTVRTHSLFQSSRILQKFQQYGIKNDSSLLLSKSKNIVPHYSKMTNLFRFPIFWEDDEEMYDKPNWEFNDESFRVNGLKILNFHPIHIFLNSNNLKNYYNMKDKIGLLNINEKNIQEFINTQLPGSRTMFEEVLSHLKDKQSYTITNLRKIYHEYF